MKLCGSMTVKDGMLEIGGVGVDQLAERYGTPLYIIDLEEFRDRARTFKENFRSERFETHIIYASKAFINLYMAQVADEEALCCDAVSLGELYTLVQAGLDPKKIYFHGNNKLPDEIDYALDQGLGTFVVDNADEFRLISRLAKAKGKTARCLLRVNPGIEAETHKYIQTTKEDSKFGMNTTDPRTKELIRAMDADEHIDFAGLHCHIGSQVLKAGFFFEEADDMVAFAKEVEDDCGTPIRELNLGGGFGVYYTAEDEPFDYADFLQAYIKRVEEGALKYGLDQLVTVSIEPGRSMINDSGSTLYRVGGVKHPTSGRPFVFVDGGMSDNLRPALYQAKYEAGLANKMDQEASETYRVAGKLCESGDILVQEAPLPQAETGDLLIMPRTGAYTYAMHSDYNRIGCPAVVFVENGRAELGVKRQSLADIIRNDLTYRKA